MYHPLYFPYQQLAKGKGEYINEMYSSVSALLLQPDGDQLSWVKELTSLASVVKTSDSRVPFGTLPISILSVPKHSELVKLAEAA